MIMRAFLGAALMLLVAASGQAQQPTEPPAAPSTMNCMMHSMQGTQGMQGMQGMQPDQAAMPSMECDCAACTARAGFAALLGKGAGALTLTSEQTTELDAILARAHEAALAVLSAEQRTALQAHAAAPGGGCMNQRQD
jgi:hypothetical protein